MLYYRCKNCCIIPIAAIYFILYYFGLKIARYFGHKMSLSFFIAVNICSSTGLNTSNILHLYNCKVYIALLHPFQ